MGCSGLLAAGLVRSYLALLGIIRPKNYGSADERGVNKRNWDFTSSGKRARSSTAAPKRFIWARKQTNQLKNNNPQHQETQRWRDSPPPFVAGPGSRAPNAAVPSGLGQIRGVSGLFVKAELSLSLPERAPGPGAIAQRAGSWLV